MEGRRPTRLELGRRPRVGAADGAGSVLISRPVRFADHTPRDRQPIAGLADPVEQLAGPELV